MFVLYYKCEKYNYYKRDTEMKVNNVSSTNFNAGVKIRGNDNLGHKYLYNEINRLTNEYKIPATFRTEEIELPTVNIDILKRLNSLKIKFLNCEKHQ